MENIDIIYYINLDHRTDRNSQFRNWLLSTGFPESKIVRIPAIYTKGFGILGCGASHIKVLETFIESNHSNCIIFEDDYDPLERRTYWENYKKLFESDIDFDWVLLSYNYLKSQPTKYKWLHRVQESQTTSGYFIKRSIAKQLLDNFKDGLKKLEITKEPKKYAIDIHWKLLMKELKCYCFFPRIAVQRESYSDIENKIRPVILN
jgi:GR25 family glycosyltransferase involved in LPS biosynthesis